MSEKLAGDTMAEYLKDHPRMAGVLFTVLLLLTQAGNVVAGSGCSCGGP